MAEEERKKRCKMQIGSLHLFTQAKRERPRKQSNIYYANFFPA